MTEIAQKISQVEAIFNETKKSFYRDSFYEFNRDVLQWPDLYEPLHRRVCDFIQDNWQKKKILLLLPRGTFKSSIVTVGFSLWQIARDVNTRTLIANATYPMAVSFLGQIKKHIQGNKNYKKIFGELYVPTDGGVWREDRISVSTEQLTSKEPTIWAYGMGGNLVGSHYNIAILDDVVARENIGTKDQIEKTKNFFKDCLDLIDPMANGHKPMIIIGTTWHWDDLYAWIMDKKNNLYQDFAILRLPAFEGDWDTGKLLFPTRLTWDTLRKLKAQQGNAHFSAQYMLNPIAEEDQVFKGPFKHYDQTDIRGIEMRKFMAVDPALSEEKSADFSAIVVVGVDRDNTWYILDVWRQRVLPNKLIDQIFFMDEKWKPISIGLETVAFQRILQYQLNDEMKKRGKFLAIKDLKHVDTSKDERIRSLQPRYELGSIIHPDRQQIKDIEYLEDELLRFPRSVHDDTIDALSSMNEIAFPARKHEERSEIHRAVYPA